MKVVKKNEENDNKFKLLVNILHLINTLPIRKNFMFDIGEYGQTYLNLLFLNLDFERTKVIDKIFNYNYDIINGDKETLLHCLCKNLFKEIAPYNNNKEENKLKEIYEKIKWLIEEKKCNPNIKSNVNLDAFDYVKYFYLHEKNSELEKKYGLKYIELLNINKNLPVKEKEYFINYMMTNENDLEIYPFNENTYLQDIKNNKRVSLKDADYNIVEHLINKKDNDNKLCIEYAIQYNNLYNINQIIKYIDKENFNIYGLNLSRILYNKLGSIAIDFMKENPGLIKNKVGGETLFNYLINENINNVFLLKNKNINNEDIVIEKNYNITEEKAIFSVLNKDAAISTKPKRKL